MSSDSKKTESSEVISNEDSQSISEAMENLSLSANQLLENAFDGSDHTISGKYSDICANVIQQTNADAAFVVVVNGASGSGYASKIIGNVNSIVDMAQMLESMAVRLREDADKARIGE